MWKSMLDVLFPPRCFGCGTYLMDAEQELGVCDPCEFTVHYVESPRCPGCSLPRDLPVGVDDYCASCLLDPPAFDGVDACFVYDGAVADALRRSKGAGEPSAALDLARRAQAWFDDRARAYEGRFWTTPPAQPRDLGRRGWDPARTLVRALSRTSPDLILRQPLRKTKRSGTKQARLGRDERHRALRGAFDFHQPISGDWVIFDDVMTTGATLNAVASALHRAGAKSVVGVVLARSV